MCYRSIWPVKLMQNINKCHNKTDICHIVHSHERVPKWTLFISWCNSATSLWKLSTSQNIVFQTIKKCSVVSLLHLFQLLPHSLAQATPRLFSEGSDFVSDTTEIYSAGSSLRSYYLLYLTKFFFCSLPKCLRTSRWGLSHTLPTSGTPGVKTI